MTSTTPMCTFVCPPQKTASGLFDERLRGHFEEKPRAVSAIRTFVCPTQKTASGLFS